MTQDEAATMIALEEFVSLHSAGREQGAEHEWIMRPSHGWRVQPHVDAGERLVAVSYWERRDALAPGRGGDGRG